ncbi:phosphonate metabolism transcriptional regulator PhnF [Roseovarius sp. D22-M7]|uniref:phosphonate metabolism transcriptional regulator PhnF n=1 Tax=Roseovarius sp. D22-M7 TaxID=3127116 RepID=UPI00300FBADD
MGKKTPLWAAIARTLREDIAEGRYVPGDKLPTEARLATRFGVNRHTVRHALLTLVDDGLVRTRRGAGAFVAARPTDYPLGKRVRFHENLLRAGRSPGRKILTLEPRIAGDTEAQMLDLAAGAQVLACHGLSLADGLPIAISESLFPITRLPGIAHALHDTPTVTAALRQSGVADYTRAATRLTAEVASATQALHLQILEGAPLLRSTSLNVGPDGVPVEYGHTWFAGDRVTLTLTDD